MLPSEGSDGQRASCDWISFGLTVVMFGCVAVCTIILNPKFLHSIGRSGKNFNVLKINLKSRQVLPMNWISRASIAGGRVTKKWK
jgi:hypothetical protein